MAAATDSDINDGGFGLEGKQVLQYLSVELYNKVTFH